MAEIVKQENGGQLNDLYPYTQYLFFPLPWLAYPVFLKLKSTERNPFELMLIPKFYTVSQLFNNEVHMQRI